MNHQPSIPFRPEPLPAMRARYQDALRQLFDIESIELGLAPPPSSRARQVFDYEDGLRLIVSREDSQKLGRQLHLSGSFIPGGKVYVRLKRIGVQGGAIRVTEHFKRLVLSRFAELSGDDRPLEFIGWTTEKMIPHWTRKE